MKTNNTLALTKAIQINQQLTSLFTEGNRNHNEYFKVVKQYVNLQYSPNKQNSIWELNGKTYSMYHTFTTGKWQSVSYNQFLEDATMMVYRLFGGEGHNTITLCDLIKEEQLDQLGDEMQSKAENGRNSVYFV